MGKISTLYPHLSGNTIGRTRLLNSDNAESIFKEKLKTCIPDNYTPWKWENYIPYQMRKN